MTVDCLWELEKSVYTALDGDVTISGLVNGVYSHVEQGALCPYIKIKLVDALDWSTKTTTGIKSRIALDVFSQQRGNKEVHDILIEIKRVIDGASLSMSGCTMVSGKYLSSKVELMSDGLTWNGEILFGFLVQKN